MIVERCKAMEHSDETLIKQFQDGDQQAFVVLTTRYFDALYRYSYRFLKDTAGTEDVVQDTFIKVWKSMNSFNEGMKVKPWIYRIAHNTAIDYLRKKKAIPFSVLETEEEEVIADDSFSLMEQTIAKEERELLTQKIEGLPVQYKEVVLLRAEEGLTFEEISMVLNKPMNTVKSLYRRALQKLQ